ncbi:multidrug efflux protein [Rhodobacteraceae bacterium RKSG542]|uniref:efflux RND transporter permease subunit n=1 Tax=Pseudovibrio flavus TaxID=2529854 RepID=UPI0012BB4BEE|nr:efflux RND transporter permease subunit [Pseudovibrio flavus]MTI16325.1 multidrug efflux protein [Pseudovibrio flavus]
MSFTDIFVRRPVLASVISLMILALGVRSALQLPVLQYPKIENAVITITTTYYGASAEVMAGFVTTPLEASVSQADGIDYITSTSSAGTSTITVNLLLNWDPDKALTEITTRITAVRNQLPVNAEEPVLTLSIGDTIDAMYLGFISDVLEPNQVTDFVIRAVQPKVQAIQGVQATEIQGGKTIAVRAWIDPAKLAAFGLTGQDVFNALQANDYISAIGQTKGEMVQLELTSSTNLTDIREFQQLVVAEKDGAVIRLQDLGKVVLGAEDYESAVLFNNVGAVYLGVQAAPGANLLDMIKGVRDLVPELQEIAPPGLDVKVVYDSGVFVDAAIDEVVRTLVEAIVIVIAVVFLFIGSPRTVAIPIIAIPLSLIGTFTIMLMLGFSINLLSLLALVLGIGLVVDDAIIVVEDVSRHISDGKKPFDAALQAGRDLGRPIIAMTIVLVSVYTPIGFQGGLTGALFTEFAFTVVGAVTVSAIVALTLTPMLSSRILKAKGDATSGWDDALTRTIDGVFNAFKARYMRLLEASLRHKPVVLTFAGIVLLSIGVLYTTSSQELAPQEDEGIVLYLATSAPNATLAQKLLYGEQIYEVGQTYDQVIETFQLFVEGQNIGGLLLKPWDERKQTATELQQSMQTKMETVAGFQTVMFQPPSLPGSSGLPVQFVIKSTQPVERVNQVGTAFLEAAKKTGKFAFLEKDLKVDQPQARLVFDRDRAAELGLTMEELGESVGTLLGGAYVNYFDFLGRSYKVIPQVFQFDRLNADQLLDIYVRTSNGTSVPLRSVATIENQVQPEFIPHFQQLNSVTISGVPTYGVVQDDALQTLTKLAKDTLPEGFEIDYAQQSRQYEQETSGFVTTFAFALLIIFLTLAAQFESFRDPLIILVSVPMSIAGALVFINIGIGGVSINIYTQVGLITLMGLISKHGILIVEVAREQQEKGKNKHDAVVAAMDVRLRPVLMTTAAMVLGVIPLIIASGAGAASRYNMGLVIATGLSIGTMFTLFVVPCVYSIIAADRKAEGQEPSADAQKV